MSKLKPPVNNNDHIYGKKYATIELVEFGDFQCPYCAKAYKEVIKILKELGENIKFVFRNFPLEEIHKMAKKAAIAAEAAGVQNKFWEMHNAIYENQKKLFDSDVLGYAEEIGLDLESFKNELKNPAHEEKIEADFESGVRSGVNGTPTFFINGDIYEGSTESGCLMQYLKKMVEAKV
jgi:protein-disulfide isomerase